MKNQTNPEREREHRLKSLESCIKQGAACVLVLDYELALDDGSQIEGQAVITGRNSQDLANELLAWYWTHPTAKIL